MPTALRSRRRPPEVLTPDEVRALIGACSNRAPTGIRNRALIAVLWRCGLRVGEALALEPRDVDLDAGTLRVRHGKGDRSRTVGLDTQAMALIARWMDRRQRLGINGRRRLFCRLDGGPLQQSYVRHLLRRLADKTGVDKRVHPHG
jgi:integrase/recombinase XerD